MCQVNRLVNKMWAYMGSSLTSKICSLTRTRKWRMTLNSETSMWTRWTKSSKLRITLEKTTTSKRTLINSVKYNWRTRRLKLKKQSQPSSTSKSIDWKRRCSKTKTGCSVERSRQRRGQQTVCSILNWSTSQEWNSLTKLHRPTILPLSLSSSKGY